MKSKIKGCIHHKSKVLKMEDGGAVAPAVMPPAVNGLMDRVNAYRTQLRERYSSAGNGMGGYGAQAQQAAPAKKSPWKNTGPTMVNKNTA